MKPRNAIVVLFLCSAVLVGCAAPHAKKTAAVFSTTIDTERKPWTSEEFVNDPTNFQFAIVSDRTGGARAGVFESAVEKLNLMQPEFVISVGDLIQGATQDMGNISEQWDEFEEIVDDLEAPFFHVPGNHDITNPVMHDFWRKKFGRDYYHFVYNNVLFLCLNSEDPPPGGISQKQIDYVAKALADNPDVRWTLIFLHKPFWSEGKINPGWLKIEEMVKGRRHTVFAGHHHVYVSYKRNGHDYIKLATTGGASQLTGLDFGKFDHVVWVTMTDQGPRLANLMLDGIHDKNVHTSEMAKISQPLGGGGWVATEAMLLRGGLFEGASTKILLTNPGPIPMTVKGSFQPNEQMQPAPAKFEVIVPPKSKKEIPVTIGAGTGASLTNLPPLILDLTGSYEREGKEPLVYHITKKLVGSPSALCARREAPVSVDGKLKEWRRLDINCNKPEQVEGIAGAFQGTRDGRFQFATAYDDDFVYIAISTFDDKKISIDGAEPRDQDALIVNLDVREMPKRSQGRQGDWNRRFKDYLLFEMSPGPDSGRPNIFEEERLPEGVKVACIGSEYGMSAEIAVPLSYVKERQGGDWNGFRLNIGLIDHDGAENDRAVIWWKPNWATRANYNGSGTFVKR